MDESAEWLIREDQASFEERLSRLQWLVEKAPNAQYWAFPGGWMAKSLFEETRYCFVYAQFFATVVLGLAYIERTLAALFFAAGRDELERASLSTLLKEAQIEGLLSHMEFESLERIRENRNGYAHFRRPLHPNSVEPRAIADNEVPESVVAGDATAVMLAVFRMVARNAA